MYRDFLIAITDLGDSSVICGIVFVGIIYLLYNKCGRGALALALALILSSCGIALAKLLFIGCGGVSYTSSINSPSGHTALSLAVYGTYTLLLCSQLRGWRQIFVIVIIVDLIAAIAATRVVLGFHNITEVMLGIIVGGVALLLVQQYVKRGPLKSFNVYLLILCIVITAALLHGFRLPAEHLIQEIAKYIRPYSPICK